MATDLIAPTTEPHPADSSPPKTAKADMSSPFRFLLSGTFAILVSAFLLNFGWLEWAFAPGGRVPPGQQSFRYVVYGVQASVGVIALLLLYRKRGRPSKIRLRTVFAWLVMGSLVYGNLRANRILDFEAEIRAISKELARTEATIESLNPILKTLAKDARNLSFPASETSNEYFAPTVLYRGLEKDHAIGQSTETASHQRLSWDRYRWPVSEDTVSLQGDERLDFWKPLFDQLDYLDHAKFKHKTAEFVGSDENRFEGKVKFSAAGKTKSGESVGISASIAVVWTRTENENTSDSIPWQISEWKVKDLQIQTAERPMFTEVTRELLDSETHSELQRSKHEDHVLNFLQTGEKPFGFSLSSADASPGVSIVDINQDGFDDVYVYLRWGKNRMLLNQRGTGFVDVAEELGLDIENHTTSALFADFDNDGDDDLFLGRSVSRTMYLENVNGNFVDRSQELGVELPYLATSLSTADYDGDGFLDLLVATSAAYRIADEMEQKPAATVATKFLAGKISGGLINLPGGELLQDYLSEEDSRIVTDLFWKNIERTVSDQYGPPSILLKNLGGNRFAQSDALPKVYRNTLQGTWSDYDQDGDQDLYLANDFAKNIMLRNDDGKLVDATDATDTSDVGFGMGVSWGDYDEDGQQDLYVSNMYSTAGSRITAHLDKRMDGELEEVFGRMARGNSLFRNPGGNQEFEKVSGFEPGDQQVEIAGWSWGSQFFDADNDGFLDIYATSGFYTAPAEVELAEDL